MWPSRRGVALAALRRAAESLNHDIGEVAEDAVHAESLHLAHLGQRITAIPLREKHRLRAQRPHVHEQAGSMGIAHERGGDGRRVGTHEHPLMHTDPVREGGDVAQLVRREGARADQVDQWHTRLRTQRPQVPVLETLDEHRRVGAIEAAGRKRAQQRRLEGQADAAEIGRMLRLRIHPHHATPGAPQRIGERKDLLEGGHRVLPIVGVGTERQALLRPQRAQLREGEILGEPSRDGIPIDRLSAAPIGETLGHVGRTADLVFVPCHQHPVFRTHEVRLDVIGAHLHSERIRGQRVLGAMPAGAAMRDDDGSGRWGNRAPV